MKLDLNVVTYLANCLDALANPDSPVEWMEVCPECGEVPVDVHGMDHLLATTPDGELTVVLIGCEGYLVVDPKLVHMGAEFPNWQPADPDEAGPSPEFLAEMRDTARRVNGGS
jgi:hypothetical protein